MCLIKSAVSGKGLASSLLLIARISPLFLFTWNIPLCPLEEQVINVQRQGAVCKNKLNIFVRIERIFVFYRSPSLFDILWQEDVLHGKGKLSENR